MLGHMGKRAPHGCAAGKAVRMGIRSSCAAVVGTVCLWGLRDVLRRGATTLPGRVAMAIDPDVVGALARRAECGSVVVCGTNGKTTTNNVLAEALEAAGMRVLCNRVGANMESGVATALLAHASTTRTTPKVFTSTNLSNRPMQAVLDAAGWACVGVVDGLDEGDPEVFYAAPPVAADPVPLPPVPLRNT